MLEEYGMAATSSYHTDQDTNLNYGEGSLLGREVGAPVEEFIALLMDKKVTLSTTLVSWMYSHIRCTLTANKPISTHQPVPSHPLYAHIHCTLTSTVRSHPLYAEHLTVHSPVSFPFEGSVFVLQKECHSVVVPEGKALFGKGKSFVDVWHQVWKQPTIDLC